MRKVYLNLFAVVSVLFVTSCATILAPKNQTIPINTGNTKATVYVDDDNRGTGDVVETKIVKDGGAKQIKIEAPGFKPAYYAALPHIMNPLVCVSCLFLYYPMGVDAVNSKSYSYSKPIECPLLNKRIIRKPTQKYISVDEVSFDIKNKDFKYVNIDYNNYLKKIDKEEEKEQNGKDKKTKHVDEDIQVDNSIFGYELDKVLKETGFIDTVNQIFRDNENTISLKANVKSITFYSVSTHAGNDYPSFYIVKSDIKWDVLNTYGEVLKTITVRSQSGEFVIHPTTKDHDFRAMFSDMIENSLDQALTNPGVASVSQMEQAAAEAKLPTTTISKPTAYVTAAADAQNSTVIVKTKDGHGSGFAISNDGYIITNFHVIASEDPKKQNTITVILSNGQKVNASIVKYSRLGDLALLKIDSHFDKCFELPTGKSFSALEEVYIMGAPKSIELGQSAAKGIISSERNVNNVNLIQTNISVSPGNSGGPMFSKDGKLYGVVVSKLIGGGAEGVAFCIPAYRITDFLSIEFR